MSFKPIINHHAEEPLEISKELFNVGKKATSAAHSLIIVGEILEVLHIHNKNLADFEAFAVHTENASLLQLVQDAKSRLLTIYERSTTNTAKDEHANG